MWELDCEESWALKNWCFWTVVLEKTLESPLDCKEIQPVHPKGNQSWVFFGRTDAEAETPILWPPHPKSWLIGKDSDAGRDWGQEEKGMTGDDREWDGWMVSPTRWTWVWMNSRSWWWTGRPGVLQFVGSQRVGHDWATDLTWQIYLQECWISSQKILAYLVLYSASLDPTLQDLFLHIPYGSVNVRRKKMFPLGAGTANSCLSCTKIRLWLSV